MVSQAVPDTTDTTFAQDVLERSNALPVIVDFWAPWCGPCRVLSPILEALAAEYAGEVQVVKLNTDDNPATASQFDISGIPAVIAFRDGAPVNQFVGALPEPQVREFFDALKQAPGNTRVQEALRLLAEGQRGPAQLHLEAALQDDPQDKAAGLTLALLLLEDGEIDRATSLAENWPDDERATAILAIAGFQTHAAGADPAELEAGLAADASDAEAHYRLGCLLALQGDWENALEHLLETVRLDRELDDDGGRLRMLDAFAALGPESPITQSYRRRLGQVLF